MLAIKKLKWWHATNTLGPFCTHMCVCENVEIGENMAKFLGCFKTAWKLRAQIISENKNTSENMSTIKKNLLQVMSCCSIIPVCLIIA